jgi:hypothetical protein
LKARSASVPDVEGQTGQREVTPVLLVGADGTPAVTQHSVIVDYVPVLDTTQYAASDVLAGNCKGRVARGGSPSPEM